MSNYPSDIENMNMPLHPTTPTPTRPISKVEYPFGMDSVEIVQGQSFPSDLEIEFDNLMATPSEVADGGCTWCKYEYSGDRTDVRLMQRCEFHMEQNREED